MKFVSEWVTVGLGFEGGVDFSDGVEVKKLSFFVVDVFLLLCKYLDWDMFDMNVICFFIRYINEENFSVDDVELFDFMRVSSFTVVFFKREKSIICGVLFFKDVN